MSENKKATCNICGEPMQPGEEMFKFHGSMGPCPKPPLPQPPTLEELLRMTVPVGPGCVAPEGTPMTPEFRVAVQNVGDDGVHFLIHAVGHNSDTLDLVANGNQLTRINE